MEGILFLIQIVVFLYSVILHEIAHGFVAYRYGDDTAKVAGRLSFNPLVHIDMVGSILVPLMLFFSGTNFLFGWAKPVPVNPNRLQSKGNPYRLVALAGIVTNVCLALISAGILKITASFGLPPTNLGVIFFVQALMVNLVLGLFNSLPLPGFDGFNFLMTFDGIRGLIERTPLGNPMFMARYGMVISILLVFLLMSPISYLFSIILSGVISFFGL